MNNSIARERFETLWCYTVGHFYENIAFGPRLLEKVKAGGAANALWRYTLDHFKDLKVLFFTWCLFFHHFCVMSFSRILHSFGENDREYRAGAFRHPFSAKRTRAKKERALQILPTVVYGVLTQGPKRGSGVRLFVLFKISACLLSPGTRFSFTSASSFSL